MTLRQVVARSTELTDRRVAIVRVFHSPVEALRHYVEGPGAAPFPVLADPKRVVYRAWGVGRGWLGLVAPSAWKRSFEARRAGLAPSWRDALTQGIRGYPADFLIDERGLIERAHYGAHFADSLSVDRLIAWIEARGEGMG